MAAAPSKQDYLKECLSDVSAGLGRPIPIDELHRECCSRCANRGCSRSAMNNSLFDVRAREWRQRFFESPPRAADDDPSYSNIRIKMFAPAGPAVVTAGGPAVVGTSPVRPNAGFKQSETVEAPPARKTEEEEAPAAPPPEAPGAPESPDPGRTLSPEPPRVVQGNTSFQQGMMLGGNVRDGGNKLGSDRTVLLEEDD